MARQTFLEETPDLDWLFSSHLQSWDDVAAPDSIRSRTVCAILQGNEDAPERVECYAVNHYQAKPIAVFVQNDNGRLILKND